MVEGCWPLKPLRFLALRMRLKAEQGQIFFVILFEMLFSASPVNIRAYNGSVCGCWERDLPVGKTHPSAQLEEGKMY